MKSIELTEQILTTVNTGKTAGVILSHIAPTLSGIRERIIVEMKNDYRSGKFENISVQSKIAQLCVIDDIESALKQQINKGDSTLRRAQGDERHGN